MTSIYTERKQCIACDGANLKDWFPSDYKTSLSLSFMSTPTDSIMMPFNILVCQDCYAAQTKYLGDLRLVYAKNHIDATPSGINPDDITPEVASALTRDYSALMAKINEKKGR